ncbi:hypothetical protein M5U04_11155 [Xenorhabdus sp. XENO-1]|nr:hypothetical protein [Xenorhabdus bovienii]MCP9268638.1 hypothetical protein [Xenorhabdus bovienii subsp. africana]
MGRKCTGASSATDSFATRHLSHLLELGYMEKTGADGRSTRYVIHHDEKQ